MANMMTVGDMRKGEDDDEDKEKFYAGGAGKHGGRYDCDLIHGVYTAPLLFFFTQLST